MLNDGSNQRVPTAVPPRGPGGGARILRPVSRDGSTPAGPLRVNQPVRTNRPIQVISHDTFARSVLPLIKRLRVLTNKSREEKSFSQLLAHVKEIEGIYNDLEILCISVTTEKEDFSNFRDACYIYEQALVKECANQIQQDVEDAAHTREHWNSNAACFLDAYRKLDTFKSYKPIPSSLLLRANLSKSDLPPEEIHRIFMTAVRSLLVDDNPRLASVQIQILPTAGYLHSVVEATFGFGNSNHRSYAAAFKAWITVRNGQLFEVFVGGIKETLWKNNDYVESEYEVFRLIATLTMARILSTQQSNKYLDKPSLVSVLTFLQHHVNAFSSTCFACRKVMRDFLPPVVLIELPTHRPLFKHLTCT